MTRHYTKEDVELRGGLPAVNVKVYKSPTAALARQVAADNGDQDTNPADFADWFDAWSDDNPNKLDSWFWDACSFEWEMIEQDATEILGRFAKCEQDGRSGGWCVVRGLADVENWDAVALAKWRKFERYARMIADDIPYQLLSMLLMNVYEREQEERRTHEREWALDLLHSLNIH